MNLTKWRIIWVISLQLLLFEAYGQRSPEYSSLKYWYAHPEKEDPSDLSPFTQQSDSLKVDVFYIHPTTYTTGFRNNGSVHKQHLRRRADIALLNQASVFSGMGRVFAPAYRQTRLGLMFKKKQTKCLDAHQMSYSDIKMAFEHYLKNEYENRPIIIASHGQGSLHAQRLLDEFWDEVFRDKLVVAYLPGYTFPPDSIRKIIDGIKVCKDSTQTGCAVVWKTQGKYAATNIVHPKLIWDGVKYVAKDSTQSQCTNPISWEANQTDTLTNPNTVALRPSNGIKSPLRITSYDLSASVVNGSLSIRGEKKFLFNGTGDILHVYDYNLFYALIRNNVKTRISRFYSN